MYKAGYVQKFYDAYGIVEWARLEATAYGRLQAIIHTDLIKQNIKRGDNVLDAGSGPGRFAIAAAGIGAKVTVLDISAGQLEIARSKLSEEKLLDNIAQFIQRDVTDLSIFPDDHFDAVICFGGAISYTCENRFKAVQELVRVTRKNGYLLVSVMCRLGVRNTVRKGNITILENPDENPELGTSYWSILDNGDLPGFESRIGMRHPAMHLFTAEELSSLFDQCRVLKIAGSNVTASEISPEFEEIATNQTAWKNIVKIEKKVNSDPGLVNSGTHLILVARK